MRDLRNPTEAVPSQINPAEVAGALREYGEGWPEGSGSRQLIDDAAAVIERLRAELERTWKQEGLTDV